MKAIAGSPFTTEDHFLSSACLSSPKTQVGMINAMRTGNLVLDMIIAMSIPLLMQGVIKLWEWLRPIIDDFIYSFRRKEEYFSRSIDYEKVHTHVPFRSTTMLTSVVVYGHYSILRCSQSVLLISVFGLELVLEVVAGCGVLRVFAMHNLLIYFPPCTAR